MAMHIARRVKDLEASSIFRINQRAVELSKQGKDILRLDAGEPDFDTPDYIKEAAIQAIRDGYTHYTPIGGLDTLKQAVIRKFDRDNNLGYGEDEVMVTCGAKQALFDLCMTLLHPGDEVVIPSPHWGSYPAMAKVAWAQPVHAEAKRENGFVLTPDELDAKLDRRTRLVMLNSPNNPTGQVYSKEALRKLGEVILDYSDVFVVTDDIYEHLRWDGQPYYNIVNACPSIKERTVVVNGVSKGYAMTGWRVGFCGGPAELIAEMVKFQGQSTSHTAAASQMAAAKALTGDQQPVKDMAKGFEKRHRIVKEGLDKIDDVDCLASDGSFYCLPDFTRAIEKIDGVENDQQLADWIMDEAGVAMVPGESFNAPNHLRLSFASGEEDLKEAMKRLQNALG